MIDETVTTATDATLAERKRETYEEVVKDNKIAAAAAANPNEIVVPSHETMKSDLNQARATGKASGIFNLLTGKK